MRLRAAPILTTAVLVLSLGAANAQAPSPTQAPGAALYRCGPQGQDLRDSPCPDDPHRPGGALPRDTVSPADAAAARRRVAAESRATEASRKARERQEAARPRVGAAGIDGRLVKPQDAKRPTPSDPKKRKPKDPKKPKPAPKPKPEPKSPKLPEVPKPPKPATSAVAGAVDPAPRR